MKKELSDLKFSIKKLNLYKAGLPNFPRNFTRDSIISGILMQNPEILKDQLIFCAKRQGKKQNPFTGEEKGKIFHEYPGVEINNLSTEYNACDTTALFLIGHKIYQKITGDKKLFNSQKKNIISATEYILRHLKEGFFIESPEFSGAKRFALGATYWKDSEIFERKKKGISYPVIFTLSHAQNLAGLRAARYLTKSKKFDKSINQMVEKLRELVNEKEIILIKDKRGKIKSINSDVLHMLYFLEKEDLNEETLSKILKESEEIETPYGYLTFKNKTKNKNKDYHLNTLWPFEQSIINLGAKKFEIKEIEEKSSKIKNYLNSFPELFFVEKNKLVKKGCDPQLWTIAAKEYFSN